MSDETNPRAAYTAALVRAQQAMAGRVHKGGVNQHARYRYAGHEQVVMACRTELLEQGLTVEAPIATEGPILLTMRTSKGETSVWLWTLHIPVSHTGGHVETYRVAATTQANDKAAFVASTAADRTLRMRLCGLAGTDEENPEHDGHDHRARSAADDGLAAWRQGLAACNSPESLADWYGEAKRELGARARPLGAALKAKASELGTTVEAVREACNG